MPSFVVRRFLAAGLLVACSSSSTPSASSVRSGDDAGAPTGEEVPGEQGADAGAAHGELLASLGEVSGTCATFCAKYGFACTPSCAGAAGRVLTGSGPVAVAACGDSLTGASGAAVSAECCCAMPAKTVVAGSPSAPQSCAKLCASKGLRCAPSEWKKYPTNEAVGSRTYRCSGTRSDGEIASCEEVPSRELERPNASACPLVELSCTCFE